MRSSLGQACCVMPSTPSPRCCSCYWGGRGGDLRGKLLGRQGCSVVLKTQVYTAALHGGITWASYVSSLSLPPPLRRKQ